MAEKLPKASTEMVERASRVCPFAVGDDIHREDEDSLARRCFPNDSFAHAAIGQYLSCYAGHVVEGPFRDIGSSGGYISWLLCKLLERGEVDAVLHVRQRAPTQDDDRLFSYAVSRTPEDIREGAKSRYYPVTMIDVLHVVREQPGRYAIAGVPCFIKALRLLQLVDRCYAERVRFCIGLVCGHLKSRRFADLLGWQLGITPGKLTSIDFRYKLKDRPANQYAARILGIGTDGQSVEKVSPMRELIGGDWGIGHFKYHACGFCDDVLAETADVAVGDAWLPQYVKDCRGANVIVVRDTQLQRLTEEAIAKDDLDFTPVSGDMVVRSQEAGLRDRRSGLAYRLHKALEAGNWTPKKRVSPKTFRSDPWFRAQQDLRNSLAAESHAAFARALRKGSVDAYVAELEPQLTEYYAHLRRSRELFRRILKKVMLSVKQRLNLSIERAYER